eukprot:7593391-Prorocentrum_lima.AAC.1
MHAYRCSQCRAPTVPRSSLIWASMKAARHRAFGEAPHVPRRLFFFAGTPTGQALHALPCTTRAS